MSFLNYLGVAHGHTPTPDELHQRVDRLQRVNDPIYVERAGAEAREFVGGDNGWMIDADRFIRETVELATDVFSARPTRIPEPGRAIVLPASWADERRPWQYATQEYRDAVSVTGRCDRCTVSSLFEGTELMKEVRHVFVAHGRFVIHFKFCLDCIGHYASLATHAIRQTFVDGHRIDEHVDLSDDPQEG